MMTNLRFLVSPTGGFTYHLLALRYRKTRWKAFLATVEKWLFHSWDPESRSILIFGASAGWTLPPTLFSHFEQIFVIEPDPLARLILRQRFPAAAIEFIGRADLLPTTHCMDHGMAHRMANSTTSFENFESLLKEHPHACILFSNVLGQTALLRLATEHSISESEHRAREDRFFTALAGREWASYHDLLSADRDAVVSSRLTTMVADGHSIEEIARQAYPEGAMITDHETLWLSRGSTTELGLWRLAPRQSHLIGFVHAKLPARNR